MNTLRLSALSLSLALAVVTLGYATPAFADKPTGAGHNHGGEDGNGETSAVYTVQLTMGGFIFGPVVVTPNKRGNAYHSQDILDMSRPPAGDPDGQTAWDSVFSTCPELLSDGNGVVLIGGVTAGDNWTINISGSKLDGSVSNNPDSDILIRFRDVVADGFPDVDIDFNLIGRIGLTNSTVTNFLPELNQTSVFHLDKFNFFGSGNRGGGCRSGIPDLLPNSVLEITRTD